MSLNDKLLKAAAVDSGITPSEHFGVMTYTGNDESGHSINGGKFGGAAYFNGSNGEITLPDGIQSSKMSVSLWLYSDVNAPTDKIVIEFSNGYGLNFNTAASGKIAAQYANSNSSHILSNSTISSGQWYHIVGVFNSSSAALYINGTSQSGGTVTDYLTSDQNTIGSRRTGQYFDGKIDQVRIFHKELSSSEVSTLYAETAATVESLDPLSEDTTDTLQVLGDTSCLALYKFENNEDDKSGNYDLTGNEIQYAAGRYGQAASFNGSSSYAEITSSPPQDSSGVMSVSFWAKTTNTSRAAFFIVEGPSTAREFLKLENYGYQGTNSFRVSYKNNLLSNIDNEAISDGAWHHIVITAGNGNVKTYKDNSLLATQSVTIADETIDNFVIGYRKYNNDLYFTGEIDQFRIFNKELSASEVTTLYQENSLVASYRFEGNSSDDRRTYDGSDSNMSYEFGLNFKPDWIWLKPRNQTENHNLFDSTRGVTKQMLPNTSAAESTQGNTVTSFDVGGFTTGSDNNTNKSGINYVAWCLKANGGTTVSNTDGDLTSQVQANTTAGFSIVTWTSSSTISDTIGHGLDKKPDAVLYKKFSSTGSWFVYTDVIDGSWDEIVLNDSTAASDYSGTYATSTTFKSVTSSSGANWVTYCFHSVEGFSHIGTYEGNGSTDGPFVETGFEPAFLMVKDAGTGSTNWRIIDNKRSTVNPRRKAVFPNLTNAEQDGSQHDVDFLSNGFQIKNSTSGWNNNNSTHFYMAFAADPDTETPTLARSFSTVTYTGTGNDPLVIDGLNLKPGLVWIKSRDQAREHILSDIVRGPDKELSSNDNSAEESRGVKSFDNDGFTLDNATHNYNNNGEDYISWAWAADDNEPTIFGGAAKAVYKFEDNVNDVTGNYNGTATSITYNSSGKFNKSADFSSSNSQITTNLAQSDTAAFTWSAWIKVHDFQGISNVNVLGTMNSSSPYNGVAIFLDVTAISLGEGGSNIGNILSSPSINTWYHIVVAYDGSKFKCYADGSLVLTVTNSNTDGGNFWMGKGGPTTWTTFDGELDQVRIYNGAVSDIGVAALYAETTSDNDNLTLAAPKETIISANANAGFSIVKFTTPASPSADTRIPHGLSSAPDMIILKRTDGTEDWYVYHTAMGLSKFVRLNSTAAQATATNMFNTVNATVFNPSWTLTGNQQAIAYCWHSVSGYSAFGYWQGGTTTITIGFRADFVMYQDFGAGGSWTMVDSVRGDDVKVLANTSDAESSTSLLTITDTGFTVTSESAVVKRLYMAFKIN